MADKIPVAVLGATGAVGQRLVSLLAEHPWFEIQAITGSERTAGEPYGQVVKWVIPGEIPPAVRDMKVGRTDGQNSTARLLFSALPASVARQVEPQMAAEGYAVCSNASALRMEPDVPLLIPEINPDHLALIDRQRERRGWPGLIVTSPNCSTTGMVFPLKALHDAFGLTGTHAVTMQAISGAGYPGVASLELHDNVIPFIGDEEAKIELETRKLLGAREGDAIQLAPFPISAQANRVPVLDGHMIALSVGLARKTNPEEVQAALSGFRSPAIARRLPSAPRRPLLLREENDRPQPRLDREAEGGMAISVGRLQACSVLDYKLVALVHNTLRGAAGGALLNAELLLAEGYLA